MRHFGYEFKYGSNSVDKDNPLPFGIPEALNGIVRRIVEQGWMPVPPDQLTVNRYLPGQGNTPICILDHSDFVQACHLCYWMLYSDSEKFCVFVSQYCSFTFFYDGIIAAIIASTFLLLFLLAPLSLLSLYFLCL